MKRCEEWSYTLCLCGGGYKGGRILLAGHTMTAISAALEHLQLQRLHVSHAYCAHTEGGATATSTAVEGTAAVATSTALSWLLYNSYQYVLCGNSY
jgi:hypothetical protein